MPRTTALGALRVAGNGPPSVVDRLRVGWPPDLEGAPVTVTIGVEVLTPRPPALGVDESYRLTIDADGIALEAPTDIGARRGIETLLQLAHDSLVMPQVTIDDEPKFAWRDSSSTRAATGSASRP